MTPTILPLLEKLIAFPSVSADGNIELIRWIEGHLASLGIGSRLTFDDSRRKANLFATIGEGDRGLILSGHTDVVPVIGQHWTSDPFAAVGRDDRIYGRGSCDMKGYIAVALSLVPELRLRSSAEPVYLAFSYDEEIGCLGVRRMLADIANLPVHARGCIIGEPTNMHAVIGHKGASMYRVTVTGRAAHSSLAPTGVNAIEYAARIIGQCLAIAERLKSNEPRNHGFDVPYSTIQINKISGGTGGNIVADRCEFLIDIRSLVTTNQDALIAELKAFADTVLLTEMLAVAPEASITFQQVGDVPAFDADAASDLAALLMQSGAGSSRSVAFGTEAGLFVRAGIPTIVCGPGSIDQAHKPDEFVEIAQLALCEKILRRTLALSAA